MRKKYFPAKENLGTDCRYWQGIEARGKRRLGCYAVGCTFPRHEMKGRMSCEGIIDDVCLFIKDGRRPPSLTQAQIEELSRMISDEDTKSLPPGGIR